MSVMKIGHAGDFESWLAQRPRWLQTAACWLVDSRRPLNDGEIADLAKLCGAEATGRTDAHYVSMQPGALAAAGARRSFRIVSLSDVRGVNALKAGTGIHLGAESVGVVYGPNGSGKSGFARLIKQMCGARSREEILSNVFDIAGPTPSAVVAVSQDNDQKLLKWELAFGALPELRNVHIFDSRTAQGYVTERSEATYEPSRMRFVSALVVTCDRVAEHLRNEKLTLVSKLPTLPPAFAETQAAKWFKTLKANTKPSDIEQATLYATSMNEERVAAEAALGQKDIPGRLRIIAGESAALEAIRACTEGWKQGLSDAALTRVIAARNDAIAKRKIATDDAKSVFESAPLQGVGQETWMALWQQAKNYSETHAFAGESFPHIAEGARCVLCQQPLSPEGQHRLSHFQAFVTGGLEANAKRAEELFNELVSKLPVIPVSENWTAQASLLRLNDGTAGQYLQSLATRSRLAVSGSEVIDLPVSDSMAVEQAIKTAAEVLSNEEKSLKQLLQDGKRKELELLLLELQAKQWLSENKLSIADEVRRLSLAATLDKADRLTNTAALTKKNGELAEQELDAGYQERFARELKLLGGKRLRVRPEGKRAGKGKVTFGLVLNDAKRPAPINSVLSEGETRVVALAAFLADITGAEHRTPFVFDDPISSLDQDFEERVVARLVDLGKSRQVIVFTHRLSLVTLVSDAVRKLDAQAKAEKVPPEVSLRVEHLRRLGAHAGIAAQMNARDVKPPNALNRMRDESIPQLRKLRDSGDVAAYDERINGLCSDFRIVVERSVEMVLLNEVVLRFRRSLETKGRIVALAKIQGSDCALIDDLMTRYSAFEHSQPDELPAGSPDIEDLHADVERLTAWIMEFGARTMPQAASYRAGA